MKKSKTAKIICLSVVSFILVLLIVINVVCSLPIIYPWIDSFLAPASIDSAARAEGQQLAVQIEQEGIVLAKNDKNELPLNRDSIESHVNVFGWDATKWIRSGDGSGRSGTSRASIKYDLLGAMNYRYIQYNENLIQCYRNFRSSDRDYDASLGSTSAEFSRLYEPSIKDTSVFPSSVLENAKAYSSTAFVVLGRITGESNDCPKVQYKQVTKGGSIVEDKSRTYLDISTEEEELLTYVGANFEKVVVIINSTNVMNLSFLDTIPGLDSCIIVSGTGAYGALAIMDIIYGIKSPSGRLVDTYAYDFKSNPSYATSGAEGLGAYTNASGLYPTYCPNGNIGKDNQNFTQVSYADYVEDIYVGYKWYETADAEGYWSDKGGYDKVVQYPFGYGLSYTTFEKELVEVTPDAGSALAEDTEITVKVKVKNSGKVAGQEVVQLYYTPEYYKGGIEKSSINLIAYAKTSTLKPGETETLTLTFKAYEMAAYDCYDKNENGHKGYELEHGAYQIKIMKNAHELDNVKGGAEIAYTVSSDIKITKDAYSGNEVVNRFTGEDAVDGVSLDGSDSNANIQFLTRSDFKGTFTSEKAADRAMTDNVKALNTYTDDSLKKDLEDQKDEAVTTGQKNGLKVMNNGSLTDVGRELGEDYYSEKWDKVLNQLSVDEMEKFVLHGYTKVNKLDSIGLPELTSTDGPSQIGSYGKNFGDTTAYPQPTVLAQSWNQQLAYSFGLAMGKEARQVGVECWYGPGINLHRHPFGGRNYEYWSEDAIMSGTMCAQTVKGAKNAGVMTAIKHLALYNTETYRDGQYVWLTEQNLRENYLKSFQIAIQKGGATGLMSSYNRIGAVWTGASSALQKDVLRTEFGYKGYIITDYSDYRDKNGIMLGDAIIRNGGDLWMDGFGDPGKFHFEHSSNQFRQALRTSCKNIIYSYLNAEYTKEVYNTSGDDVITVEKGSGGISWWVIVGIVMDVLVVASCAFWVYWAFFHKPKKIVDVEVLSEEQTDNEPLNG